MANTIRVMQVRLEYAVAGLGPLLWADRNKPRGDGLTYLLDDLVADGTHPEPSAHDKIAHMLLDFLKKDPTAQPWFIAQ